jgi:hypothetical protein
MRIELPVPFAGDRSSGDLAIGIAASVLLVLALEGIPAPRDNPESRARAV